MASGSDRIISNNMKLVFVTSLQSTQHYREKERSKDWLAQNKDKVSEWYVMSISGLSFH